MSLVKDPEGKRPPYDLKVEWPHVNRYKRIPLDERTEITVPEQMTGTVETEQYHLIVVTGFDAKNGQTCVDRLTVERKPGALPISGDVLNRLGCGDVVRQMVDRASFRWEYDAAIDSWQLIEMGPLDDARAVRRFERPTRAAIDAQAREVAQLYRDTRAEGRRVTRADVAASLGVSVRTVTRRVDYARDAGYLSEETEA